MKFTKKFFGILMCVTLMMGLAAPAFAADPPVIGAATGNVLSYNYDEVLVPTTMKMALNPNEYDITIRYNKTADTSVDSSKTYYSTADGTTFTKVTSPVDASIGDYYEAETSDAQIVSLNYGIVNKSTKAKTVSMEFELSYTKVANKTAIEFVDAPEKAQAYDASTNADGAKAGELKMFLAVGGAENATGFKTQKYYFETEDTSYQSAKTYYTLASGKYTAASITAFAADTTYYEESETVGPYVTAAVLGDITMSAPHADSYQAFVKEDEAEGATTTKAKASIAFMLDKAVYTAKDGEIIDFSTTQANLGAKLKLSSVPGYTGFTLVGEMNPGADWGDANASSITITPTYEVDNSDGSELPVTNTLKQVTLGPVLAAASAVKVDNSTPITATVNNLGALTIDSVTNTRDGRLDPEYVTISDNQITLKTNLLVFITDTYVVTLTLSDSTELTFTVTIS